MIFLAFLLFFLCVIVVVLTVRAHFKAITTGKEGLLQETGIAKTDIIKDGMVMIHGELWTAETADDKINQGEKVRIVKIDGMKLIVQRSGK